MQTSKEVKTKVSVPSIDGEMANCYDTSCEGCNGPDCFLYEGLKDNVKEKDLAFFYPGNTVDFLEFIESMKM